jgi:hypothetical protein
LGFRRPGGANLDETPFSGKDNRESMVGMIPIFPIVVVFALLYSAASLAAGAVCGLLVSLLSKGHRSKLRLDAFCGLLGFWGGFFGAISMPWHRNTITERLDGGGTVTTTMNSYQHPFRIAVVFAVLFPILYEVYRLRRETKTSTHSSSVS